MAIVGLSATLDKFTAQLKALEDSVAVKVPKAQLVVNPAIGALQYHTHENMLLIITVDRRPMSS